MCNDYRRRKAYRDYVEGLKRQNLHLVSPSLDHAPNLEPQDDIMPTVQAPIFRMRKEGDGLEMVTLRWGLVPWFYKGPVKAFGLTTFNAKGEELSNKPTYREAFKKRRCLIPADGWYEFKAVPGAPKSAKKSKFLFTERGEEWFCFAGLWDRADTENGLIESFTMVTGAPGPTMQPYHHRAPVVLRRSEWAHWLDTSADVNPILLRESEDRFDVVQVR